LTRFGASVINDDKHAYIVGGIINRRLLEEDEEVGIVKLDTLDMQTCAVNASNHSRPLLVGTTAAALSSNLIITGGSAVCFSFGTFWNKGCYTLSIRDPSGPPGLAHFIVDSGNQPSWKYQYTRNDTTLPCRNVNGIKAVDTSAPESVVVAVSRTRLQSAAEFTQLLENGVPCIVEKLYLGPCTSKWTAEYLKDKVGDKQVSSRSIHYCVVLTNSDRDP